MYCFENEVTYHALTATASVENRFVLRDRTVAATPYENPEYRNPVPSARGSGCHVEILFRLDVAQSNAVSTVPRAVCQNKISIF